MTRHSGSKCSSRRSLRAQPECGWCGLRHWFKRYLTRDWIVMCLVLVQVVGRGVVACVAPFPHFRCLTSGESVPSLPHLQCTSIDVLSERSVCVQRVNRTRPAKP